jgi:hypothetical protein
MKIPKRTHQLPFPGWVLDIPPNGNLNQPRGATSILLIPSPCHSCGPPQPFSGNQSQPSFACSNSVTLSDVYPITWPLKKSASPKTLIVMTSESLLVQKNSYDASHTGLEVCRHLGVEKAAVPELLRYNLANGLRSSDPDVVRSSSLA